MVKGRAGGNQSVFAVLVLGIPATAFWPYFLGLIVLAVGLITILLKEWSQGAQINTDRNLRLQYLAGMWLNSSMGARTLSSILAHYRFPDQTFVGSPERIGVLKQNRSRPTRFQ